MSGDFIFVYIPCASQDEAQKIGRTLVEEKLAACANILAPMQSIYEWDGKITQADEVPLLLKTYAGLYDKLAARVKALHSYKTPCIAALDVLRLNNSFADWIRKQTLAN